MLYMAWWVWIQSWLCLKEATAFFLLIIHSRIDLAFWLACGIKNSFIPSMAR